MNIVEEIWGNIVAREETR